MLFNDTDSNGVIYVQSHFDTQLQYQAGQSESCPEFALWQIWGKSCSDFMILLTQSFEGNISIEIESDVSSLNCI